MEETKPKVSYVPTDSEISATEQVLKDLIKGRNIISKSYNQFNGMSLYDSIDEWTKRWNGYIEEASATDALHERSRMFLNITRNLIINYLSKVALNLPKIDVIAVNKYTNIENKAFAQFLKDLNEFSNNEENAERKFFDTCLELSVKGTCVKYEGYAKYEQDTDIIDKFDAQTGKIEKKKGKRTIFDNCYQEVVPIEDFYIANPYQPDIQKQPWLIWRKITTFEESQVEYGHYKNFDRVKAGDYTITSEPTTFYRNELQTELQKNEVEIVRYYNRMKNRHIILINGVCIYEGPMPFKDGLYPFVKGIQEPYDSNFFWGMSMIQKWMGDQDLINSFWNMMADKTFGSLQPFGLSSDIDDFVDDTTLETNKIRKVGDINNWTVQTFPGVTAGEQGMLQSALSFVKENSGIAGGGDTYSPKGGKISVRQTLLKQQDILSKLGFSMSFLEDFERERTTLRIHHLLQFYSIPKIEKITGKKPEVKYRDIKLQDVQLSNGETGNKVVKLVGDINENKIASLEQSMSEEEQAGYDRGTPTEVLAVNVDTFNDFNFKVQVVGNSSYEKNQIIEQSKRMEYAQWRISLLQIAPCDPQELVKWVDESFDIPSDRFSVKGMPSMNPIMEMAGQGGDGQGGMPKPLAQMGPKEQAQENKSMAMSNIF